MNINTKYSSFKFFLLMTIISSMMFTCEGAYTIKNILGVYLPHKFIEYTKFLCTHKHNKAIFAVTIGAGYALKKLCSFLNLAIFNSRTTGFDKYQKKVAPFYKNGTLSMGVNDVSLEKTSWWKNEYHLKKQERDNIKSFQYAFDVLFNGELVKDEPIKEGELINGAWRDKFKDFVIEKIVNDLKKENEEDAEEKLEEKKDLKKKELENLYIKNKKEFLQGKVYLKFDFCKHQGKDYPHLKILMDRYNENNVLGKIVEKHKKERQKYNKVQEQILEGKMNDKALKEKDLCYLYSNVYCLNIKLIKKVVLIFLGLI